jgi:hypothetical protein
MAVPLGIPPGFALVTPLPLDRARGQQLPQLPNKPPAGSLVLIDNFQDSYEGAAHGNTAAYAARQQGFKGNIYAEDIGPDVIAGPSESSNARTWLSMEPQDPAKTRQAVQDISRLTHRELLEDVTGDLNKIQKSGLHDSAVNVSYGVTPQRIAEDIYRDVRGGFGPLGGNQQFADNVLNAYGIDAAKFNSLDGDVSGPERAKLQQALLKASEAGAKAPDVVQAQKNYADAVRNLEANHNSVVVSAGNQGQVLAKLTADAGGRAPTPGPGSNHNILANSGVTTVGATQWLNSGTERIAPYSNRFPEVDLYASGSVGSGQDPQKTHVDGTSFSAPRVAATMATVHGNHPGMPSSAVENLMRNRLTHQTEDVSVLDYKRTEEYMRRGTF